MNLFMLSPQMTDHLANSSIMGGAFDDGFTYAAFGHGKGESDRFGLITPYAKLYVLSEPEAANGIFANSSVDYNTFLVPIDVTSKFLAMETALEMLDSAQRRKIFSANPEVVDPALVYSTPQEYAQAIMTNQKQDRARLYEASATNQRGDSIGLRPGGSGCCKEDNVRRAVWVTTSAGKREMTEKCTGGCGSHLILAVYNYQDRLQLPPKLVF